MENCFGPLSANPCQACIRLSRQKNQARRTKREWTLSGNADRKTANKDSGIHKTLAPQPVDDATNDAQLAQLAQHLCMSEQSDYDQRQAAKDPFDERVCEKCFLSFSSKQARLEHIKRSNMHIVCRWCKDPTEYATEKEFGHHRCGDWVRCWLCLSPTVWPNRPTLQKHKWEAHLTCQACDMDVMYLSKEYLRKHKQAAHAALYCEFCNMLLDDEASKKNHMKGKHSKCLHCQVYFENRVSRAQHRILYCHFCKQGFTSRIEKEGHYKSLHANVCEDCAFYKAPNKKYCHWHSAEEKRKEREKWYRKAWSSAIYGFWSKLKATAGPKRHEKGQTQDSYGQNPPPKPLPEGIVDLYAVLRVNSKSSAEEIEKAAKKRRIKTHPDRLERRDGLTEEEKEHIREEAKQVGWAADILTDPITKASYDREVRRASTNSQEGPFQ